MVLHLIRTLKRAQKKRNPMAFEIIEKTQVHVQNAYRYKALIRVRDGVSSIDTTAVAAKIQRTMGRDPFAYLIYDVSAQVRNENIVELTWASWDSCD